MDQQDDTLDFKALRAKFQDQEILPKQPRTKPALPEKPKVVPPPQSPPHYLPAGARPSLLTSINQSLEGKTAIAPRVVFKDDKKESKKPLLQTNSKGKDKSEGKMKKNKEKASKAGKEKLIGDSPDPKPKKDKKVKNSTAELVEATPPPKATPTKKGFLGFKKSAKRDSAEVPANPILDTPSSEVPVQVPLIPVPSAFDDTTLEPEINTPKALLPNIPTLPDSSSVAESALPPAIPASPDFTPTPAFIPDTPAAPADPAPEIKTPPETETPALPVSIPKTQIEALPDLPEAAPTPPPSSDPPLVASSPSPPEPEVDIEPVNADSTETPLPPPAADPASIPPSPKAERPISALSALERAEDMSLGKKTPPCDQRIFNALEKARKKPTSTLTNPATSSSVTPPEEELPPPQSPTTSLPELPPIDYEDRAGQALPKPPEVNGLDHSQASPGLEGITEDVPDAVPELMVVPPPPPRKALPDAGTLGPAPEKPDRPPSVNLTDFIPPPLLEDNEIPVPHELSETDYMEASEFDNVASDAYSSELQVSDWGSGEYAGSCTPEPELMSELYSNGMITPEADAAAAAAAAAYGDQEPQLLESSLQESPPQTELQTQVDNIYESAEVSTSASKKKGNGIKKRKGPPKNPYAEASQEPIEEKTKTGRFGKSDKKAASDGPDEKELKKKEKQRLEREKKELKEKQEREKKEQKEREKKENEMKKKFKIMGQEEAMYKAKVTVTTKGRKNDLPLKSGDNISIIRTTDCPKGKWLARDSSNNYGYVAVDHVELDIQEMLELGKKAAVNRKNSSQAAEAEVTSVGSRASNHYPVSHESFTDDSEEWTGDEEPVSPAAEPAESLAQISHARTLSMPDMGNKDVSINHQHSISADGTNAQAKHEALQKLATFFHAPKPVEPAASNTEPETDPVLVTPEAENLSDSAYELDFDQSEMLILPPPELYADLAVE